MKFDYKDYPTETELGLRWYITPDGAFPSITTILGVSEPPEKKASLDNWRNSLGALKADAHTKKAQDHGTMVHLCAERFLKGEDPFALVDGKPISDIDKAGFNGLKLKLKQITEVWGQEQSIYSPLLEVAGRFDCVGIYKNRPMIIDFKTAGRIKNKNDIKDYYLQLAFYAAAHNETFGTDIQEGVILMSAAGGMPLEFIVKIDEHLEPLVERIEIFWEKTLARVK